MFFCKVFFLILLLTSGRNGEEPRCSKYDFEEKMLEKMVRMEFQMERMKTEVEQCVKTIEDIKAEVSDQMKKNQLELEADLDAKTIEVTNATAAVHAKLRELENISDKFATPPVAFKARLNVNSAVTVGQVIVFPTVIFNEGSAYNPSTGKFTASVSGSYIFTIAFCVYSSKRLVVSIMIEGKKYSTSLFYGDSNHECLSADTVAIVKAGQSVWVEGQASTQSGTILDDHSSYRWNTFSGALLNLI